MLLRLSSAASLLLLVGCATMFNGTNQRVPVASRPPGAEVHVDCPDVHYDADRTPTTIIGLFTAMMIGSGGGLVDRLAQIGWGLFLFTPIVPSIDRATGAAYMQYPQRVIVRLER